MQMVPNISTRSSLETGRGVLDPINSLELKNSWLSMLATSALPAYTYVQCVKLRLNRLAIVQGPLCPFHLRMYQTGV